MRYLSESAFDINADLDAVENIGGDPPYWQATYMAGGAGGMGWYDVPPECVSITGEIDKIQAQLIALRIPENPTASDIQIYHHTVHRLRGRQRELIQKLRTCYRRSQQHHGQTTMSGMGIEPITTAAAGILGGTSIIGSLVGAIFGSKQAEQQKAAAQAQLKAAKLAAKLQEAQAAQAELDRIAQAERSRMYIWGGIAAISLGGIIFLKSRRGRR